MLAGGLIALVHAFFAIHLRADQIVGGTAINFLALGITGYFFIAALRTSEDVPPSASRRSPTSSIPRRARHFLGDRFGQLT